MEIGMRREEEVRLTHSGIFAKDGRRCVSVRFERGRDVAEAVLPACRVTKNEGFTDEEVRGLEQYLESKNDEIFAKAKEINPNGIYIFEPNGSLMTTDSFNRRLKKYCREAGVPYYSSHKIRFYNASTAYDGKNLTAIRNW